MLLDVVDGGDEEGKEEKKRMVRCLKYNKVM